MTAAAAAIGVSRHPSISSRTTRNSAAASAAEIRARAAFAARCGRPAARTSPTTRSRLPSAIAAGASTTAQAIAAGTWTRKIDCQLTSSVSRPPTPGPSAAPSTPEAAQTVAARRSEPTTAGSSSSEAQTAAAPPTACTQRANSSSSIEPERPQTRLEPAKTRIPPSATRAGPSRRAAAAAGSAAIASTRLKAIRTQVTALTETSSSR